MKVLMLLGLGLTLIGPTSALSAHADEMSPSTTTDFASTLTETQSGGVCSRPSTELPIGDYKTCKQLGHGSCVDSVCNSCNYGVNQCWDTCGDGIVIGPYERHCVG